jgi:hypothetical protein
MSADLAGDEAPHVQALSEPSQLRINLDRRHRARSRGFTNTIVQYRERGSL